LTLVYTTINLGSEYRTVFETPNRGQITAQSAAIAPAADAFPTSGDLLNAGIAANLPEGFEDLYEREHIPLARRGRPEEVAGAYAFLASDDATFIHGTELVIDGGQLAIM
jgi:NAD(P)-dependent dehydrogenase (short-subunit alcohol dehydrogenase family)